MLGHKDQYTRVRECRDAIAAAVLKIQMMGLTFPACMVECPPPKDIHPLRWRAMIQSALQNGIPE